jgi:CDP-diacylglycerol--serine O-phosphatidyltransferase
MGVGVVLLGVLMVSHVPYPKVPKIGLRTPRGLLNTTFVLGSLFAAVATPRYFVFSFLLVYTLWGLIKSVLLGLLDRLPGGDPLLDADSEDDEDRAEVRALDYRGLGPQGDDDADHDVTLEERA